MTRYKIGEMARLMGLSTQALRFYEQEGIIVPQKSESGTRYYTSGDIIRLLAYRKYKVADFSVQDVAQHFSQGSLDGLIAQLGERSDALIAESEMLLRRARAVRGFERTLREAQTHEGEMICMDLPEIYLYRPTFDELNTLNEHERETFHAFVNALPETNMCFTCPADLGKPAEFRIGVSRQSAELWQLPLDDVIHLPAFHCVRIYVRAKRQPWETAYLESLTARVCEAGYSVRGGLPVIGFHLASETIGRQVYLYGVICIPVA